MGMNLDLDPFFRMTAGCAVRILDGTKHHGQVVPTLIEWNGIRIVELDDGTPYSLLFNEYEVVVPPKPPPPPPKRVLPKQQGTLGPTIEQATFMSRCPKCKIDNTLNHGTLTFMCCGMHLEMAMLGQRWGRFY